MKKNIAVLMGGYSLEHDISIKSGLNVFNSIDKFGSKEENSDVISLINSFTIAKITQSPGEID